MGKSTKKSASKVETASVVAAPSKPFTKGKREAEVKKEVVNAKKQKTKLPTMNGKVKSDSDSDSSRVDEESSSDEEAAPAKKAAPVKASPVAVTKKKDESSDKSESEEETSSDDEKKAPAAAAKKKDDSSEESDSDDESESDDDAPNPVAAVKKATSKVTKKKEESEDDSDEEGSEEESSEDEKPTKMQGVTKTTTSVAKKSSDSEESSEDEVPAKTPKKNGTDVEMTDAEKTPKTPSTPKEQGTGGSKTLFVGNLSFSVEQADVENFFKPAGEVVDVRFAMKDDSFRGFGHVEFATSEEAQKALNELNGKDLLGRAVKLDLAREKGAYTPGANETQSYQKGGKSEGGTTIFVRGFDKYGNEDETRSALQEHFGSCGEITRVSIPTDRESGQLKGMAYIDFTDRDAFNKALGLDGSEFGDTSLTVNEAQPRGDGGGGGGRSSGSRFGRGGGRDSGGRRGRGRGGRDSGGGRFGRGRGRGGRR